MNVLHLDCPICDAATMIDLDGEASLTEIMDRVEKAIIEAVLKKNNGNAAKSARELKIEAYQIRYFIKKHGLK